MPRDTMITEHISEEKALELLAEAYKSHLNGQLELIAFYVEKGYQLCKEERERNILIESHQGGYLTDNGEIRNG